jgi:hypothetical protein
VSVEFQERLNTVEAWARQLSKWHNCHKAWMSDNNEIARIPVPIGYQTIV